MEMRLGDAGTEDARLLAAVRAEEGAEVLHQAEHGQPHLAGEVHRAAGVGQGHLLGARHHQDAVGPGNQLGHR